VILIAADVVPLASGVRGASKAIRVGSQSFIAIGAGARIINGAKEALEGTATTATGVDVVVAVLEGTAYTLTRARVKLRISGDRPPGDVVDLMSVLHTNPKSKTPRPIIVADEASAKRLAAFFKGKRSAQDIMKNGLTPEELLEIIDANLAAVRARVSQEKIKGRYQDGLPAADSKVTPDRLDFDPSDADYWEAGKVLEKRDAASGRVYQRRMFVKDKLGEKIIVDLDLTNHMLAGHKSPHYHVYRYVSGSWS
jgi:hypothetical protein